MAQGLESCVAHRGIVVSAGKAVWLWGMVLFGSIVSVPTYAQSCDKSKKEAEKQVFWGDLHIHTSFSMDAYVWDNQITPGGAYRFAKGEPVVTKSGESLSLSRPLDFAAVTDHAEYFALAQACQIDKVQTPFCRDLGIAAAEDSRRGFTEFFLPALLAEDRLCQGDAQSCELQAKSLWQRTIDAANEANQPCEFTALVANEWTPSPGNLHWHRNLIYASDIVPDRAINSFDEPDQVSLWRALSERCESVEGCEVLAIPHNSNLSLGGTFATKDHTVEELSLRARFERLVEIHQHKGVSECYPASNLSDEECDFENVLPAPILREITANPRPLTDTEQSRIASGYLRDTLGRGLVMKETTGVNPFVYGFVGATDTHSGRPGAVDDAGWRGAVGSYDLDEERLMSLTHYNPGGLTAVWARQNTRAAIFAALQNRETYATSGPRIGLKFGVAKRRYGCAKADKYTPMGGTYNSRREPSFMVHVQQDEVPIDQIDIVKLSMEDGEVRQHIVTWRSDQAGRADWCITWEDPEYNAQIPAAWYVRVLQKPTLRWDGKNQVKERAWSSPIWSGVAAN